MPETAMFAQNNIVLGAAAPFDLFCCDFQVMLLEWGPNPMNHFPMDLGSAQPCLSTGSLSDRHLLWLWPRLRKGEGGCMGWEPVWHSEHWEFQGWRNSGICPRVRSPAVLYMWTVTFNSRHVASGQCWAERLRSLSHQGDSPFELE